LPVFLLGGEIHLLGVVGVRLGQARPRTLVAPGGIVLAKVLGVLAYSFVCLWISSQSRSSSLRSLPRLGPMAPGLFSLFMISLMWCGWSPAPAGQTNQAPSATTAAAMIIAIRFMDPSPSLLRRPPGRPGRLQIPAASAVVNQRPANEKTPARSTKE